MAATKQAVNTAKTKHDPVVMQAAYKLLGLKNRQALHWRLYYHKSAAVRKDTAKVLVALTKLYSQRAAAQQLVSQYQERYKVNPVQQTSNA